MRVVGLFFPKVKTGAVADDLAIRWGLIMRFIPTKKRSKNAERKSYSGNFDEPLVKLYLKPISPHGPWSNVSQ